MAKPKFLLHCGSAAFPDTQVVCLGTQIGAIVAMVSGVRPDLTWYAADVSVEGPMPFARDDRIPRRIGDSAELIRAVGCVNQFVWGVFAGVAPDRLEPTFRDAELWTEDDEDADLGSALVEVRAFDTTYISVATSDPAIRNQVLTALPGTEEL